MSSAKVVKRGARRLRGFHGLQVIAPFGTHFPIQLSSGSPVLARILLESLELGPFLGDSVTFGRKYQLDYIGYVCCHEKGGFGLCSTQ